MQGPEGVEAKLSEALYQRWSSSAKEATLRTSALVGEVPEGWSRYFVVMHLARDSWEGQAVDTIAATVKQICAEEEFRPTPCKIVMAWERDQI